MIDIENYQKEKLSIDLGFANAFGIGLLIPTLIVYGLPYYLMWSEQFSVDSLKQLFTNVPYAFIVMILGIILHELIHGVTFSQFSKNGFKDIRFGILWKMLTPYCHCKEPLKVNHYILGAIMPAILLGVIPSIISIAIGNRGLLIFGIFFTVAAAGDFLIINLIRKENKDGLVLDHPSEAGCFIFRKVNQVNTDGPVT